MFRIRYVSGSTHPGELNVIDLVQGNEHVSAWNRKNLSEKKEL